MAPVTGNARVDLAAHLLEALEPKGISVYAYPPDTYAIPAVVVMPGDPYVLPGSMGGPWFLEWTFDVTLITTRGDVEAGLTDLEALISDVITDLLENQKAGYTPRWVTSGAPFQMDEEGQEYMAIVLTVAIRN